MSEVECWRRFISIIARINKVSCIFYTLPFVPSRRGRGKGNSPLEGRGLPKTSFLSTGNFLLLSSPLTGED